MLMQALGNRQTVPLVRNELRLITDSKALMAAFYELGS